MKAAFEPRQAKKANVDSESEKKLPSMVAPAFSLTADGDDGGGGKEKVVNGPIASKGAGDDHAFAQDDVDQGWLEDCWFMAAIASMAKSDPDYLESLICDNGDGTYDVKLFFPDENGDFQPKYITVSNSFPLQENGKLLGAGQGDNSEIWVMLLEKAYAQEIGGYDKIGRGLSNDGFALLTGERGRTIDIDNRKSSPEKEAKKGMREDKKYDRQFDRLEKKKARHPGEILGQMAPKDPRTNITELHEWEIAEYLQNLLNEGAAVTLSTTKWEGKRKIAGFEVFAPHVYTIKSIDEKAQTIDLVEPSGWKHLNGFPIKLLRKHFGDISILNRS